MTDGWTRQKLGDLCAIELGKTPARANPSYWDEKRETGNVWLSIADLLDTQDNVVVDSKEYLSDKGAAVSKTVREGTLLVSFKLTLGRLAFAGRDLFTNEAIAALTIHDKRELSKHYLFYFLHFFDWDKATEGDVKLKGKTLNKAKLREMNVHFPPLPEQQRIVRILDEAFEGIATAKANAEKNLQNARDLFQRHLQSVFLQPSVSLSEDWTGEQVQGGTLMADATSDDVCSSDLSGLMSAHGRVQTRTGGREATTRHIPGPLSLSVCMPSRGTKPGWRWTPLSKLARLESGHTPSRRHPEYWGGSIPWITLQDARDHHGRRISDTEEHTNELGLANSSARLLPKGTVCLSRTASVGYVVIMGQPMATSQDFVNWVCSESLSPEFLQYLFLAESREGFLRYSSGSVHQTIYFPEVKAFCICHPGRHEQERIVRECDAIRHEAMLLEAAFEKKPAALEELRKSLLNQAFSGEL